MVVVAVVVLAATLMTGVPVAVVVATAVKVMAGGRSGEGGGGDGGCCNAGGGGGSEGGHPFFFWGVIGSPAASLPFPLVSGLGSFMFKSGPGSAALQLLLDVELLGGVLQDCDEGLRVGCHILAPLLQAIVLCLLRVPPSCGVLPAPCQVWNGESMAGI